LPEQLLWRRVGRSPDSRTILAPRWDDHDLGTTLGRRIVGPASEISFLEAKVVEHSLDDCDVLRLPTVRGTRHRELLFTPAERIEAARAEKRQHLERFGAGAPVGERVRVARCA